MRASSFSRIPRSSTIEATHFTFFFSSSCLTCASCNLLDAVLCPNSHGHRDMDSLPFRRVLGQCKSSRPRQRQGNQQATGIKAAESAGRTWIQTKRSPGRSSEKSSLIARPPLSKDSVGPG
ncbi:hypothetical protein CI102_5099 [Trichoderma harzianum]|nr:hypothetical protein CI102_5099 [Trichoderma harzianum]